jgi:hypothetical protein
MQFFTNKNYISFGFFLVFQNLSAQSGFTDPSLIPDTNIFSGGTDTSVSNVATDLKVDCKWTRGSILEPGVLPEDASPEWQAFEVLKLSCKSLEQAGTNLSTSFVGPTNCTSASDYVCIEKSTVEPSINLNTTDYTDLGYVLYKNANTTSTEDIIITKGTIGLVLNGGSSTKIEVTGDKFDLEDLIFKAYGKGLSCDVFVSGVINNSNLPGAQCNSSASCTPEKFVDVKNGTLVFVAQLKGFEDSFFTSNRNTTVTWSNGPNEEGIWETVTANTEHTVRATLIPPVATAKPRYCAIKFKQQLEAGRLNLSPLGDCELFRNLRNYYFYSPDGTQVQVDGYKNGGISLPGVDQAYGVNKPELPIQGIVNSATKTDGTFNVIGGGLGIPPIGSREYVATVITASPFDATTKKISAPVAWGTVELNNYSSVKMTSIGDALEKLPLDSLIVFQAYVAHSQTQNGVEKRGDGGIDLYKFTPNNSGVFDKIVPFVNDSCLPNFQFSIPTRPDKPELPAILRSATLCAYSRPEKVGDLKNSRVSQTILAVTPLNATHIFPTALVPSVPIDPQASEASQSSEQKVCWTLSLKGFGEPQWQNTAYEWESLKKINSSTVYGENECSVEPTSTTTPGALGFQYARPAFSWTMSFGCAVTLDKPGYVYSVAKIKWKNGTNEKAAVYNDLAPPDSSKPYYGSINCYVGRSPVDNIKTGSLFGVIDEMNNIFTSKSHNFTKSSSSYGVRTQRFYIRPLGADASSLEKTSYGFFDVPLCPGSQFKFDSISVSWSPLVLDIKGNGINVSRDFKRSVGFYLHNKKYLSYVDWPENVDEVAILVRPSYKGGAIGLSDLYGDTNAANGFEQLRKHDSNKDGLITKADKDYSKLRLWFDKNRNAQVDKDELEPIGKYSVDKIYLSYTKPLKGFSAAQRSLLATYWNAKKAKFFNIEDIYVNEYKDKSRMLVENKKK